MTDARTDAAAHDRPDAYDGLARAYARFWATRYHDAAEPVLERLAYTELPSGARVLDLCCGAGHLTERLLRRGYAVVGLDGSADMLAEARARLPGVPLVRADAAVFVFAAAFDAVLCTFDSLNHVLQPVRLAGVFRSVQRALRPSALFVFDVNTEEAYLREWSHSSTVVNDDSAVFVRGGYDATARIGYTDVTAFTAGALPLDRSEAGGRANVDSTAAVPSARNARVWERADVRVWQRPWEEDEVVEALEAAGFTAVTVHAASAVGMEGAIGVGRMFVTARAS